MDGANSEPFSKRPGLETNFYLSLLSLDLMTVVARVSRRSTVDPSFVANASFLPSVSGPQTGLHGCVRHVVVPQGRQ